MKDTASEEDLRPLIIARRKINEQHWQCRCPAKESIPHPWGALSSQGQPAPLVWVIGIVLLPGVVTPPGQGSRAGGGCRVWAPEGRECPGKGKGGQGLSDLTQHRGSCKVCATESPTLQQPFQ